MRILLTNDDGINAQGLYELYLRLVKSYDVSVCAPDAEKSAIGHAITLNTPLRIKKVLKNKKFYGYSVDGTPADCVKIAVRSILKGKPQLIISGINHGQNLGSDIMYSGTVSAATEGTILGIPSIAVSLATYKNHNFDFTADLVSSMVKKIKKKGLPSRTLLNVNVPSIKKNMIKGVMVTKQGKSLYQENFVKRDDPRGNSYYWLSGKVKWLTKPAGSDIKAIEDGYVSITPLKFDLTDYKAIDDLKEMDFKLP
ncbi:MAG: 5'/3'-nucleotidase SurE [Candidatus Omnitrophica bacterium]|nr:5'/3'-nucleotidase SurE [Candidatus Omnitrophota bacterium]